ncbi:PCNA-associated factor-like [Thamnophis elegans]|uniref:PCNA-associated factor n=1 Tax=Thamnophis elegans TaxID=35005 RepID=UPI00137804E8|nr:PCNA-associated factor [Thamnophis elegans]XP_032089258.1 PCNA-associated factor-like [Thamnophis elegans]
MVRTKANCGGTSGAYRKVVAARAPRKALVSGQVNVSSSPASRKGESKYAGGNPVCVRPTPTWQKGIGEFFRQTPNRREKENHNSEEEPGCSEIGKRRKRARPLPPCPAEQEESEDDQM